MVRIFIETSKGSSKKYELKKGKIKLDQILPRDMKFPTNYGFVPDTKADDNDELDVIVISKPLKPKHYDVKIIGVLKLKDEGLKDDKLVAVLKSSKIKSLRDVKIKKKILYFIANYKGSKIKILGWGSASEAKKILNRSKT